MLWITPKGLLKIQLGLCRWQDPSTIQRNEDASMDYATFLNNAGKEKVEKYKRMDDIISQENNEELFTLFRLWEYFQENRNHTMILSDE